MASPIDTLSWAGFVVWTLFIVLVTALIQAFSKDLYSVAKGRYSQRTYQYSTEELNELSRQILSNLVLWKNELTVANENWISALNDYDITTEEKEAMLDATLHMILPICHFFHYYRNINKNVLSAIVGFEERNYPPHSTLQRTANDLGQMHINLMVGPFKFDATRELLVHTRPVLTEEPGKGIRMIEEPGEIYRIIELTENLIESGEFGPSEFEYTVHYLERLIATIDEMIDSIEELKQMLTEEY